MKEQNKITKELSEMEIRNTSDEDFNVMVKRYLVDLRKGESP